MVGLSLKLKYVFLSFAQEFFKSSPVVGSNLRWKEDPTTTNVIIADKYAIDTGVAAKRPSIILSRGSMGWSGTYRNEGTPKDPFKLENNVPFGSADWERNKEFTDLLSGSITYNVISKYGVKAERVADLLYMGLTGYRDQFKKKGIHKMQNLSISDERVMKQGSDIEVSGVSISLSFLSQITVNLGEKQNNVRVFLNGDEVYEGVGFRVVPDGTQIEFREAPKAGDEISINYVDAITLNQQTDVTPVESPDGSRTKFTLPNNGTIYGMYKIVDTIIINETNGDSWTTVD